MSKTQKGYSLIELLAVLSVMVILSVVLAGFTTTTLRDIPRSLRIMQANTVMLNMLQQLNKDIDPADELPDAFEQYKAGTEMFLIKSSGGVVRYQFNDGQVSRQNLNTGDTQKWPIPHGRIEWKALRKDDKNYAIEITTYIEQKQGERIGKKMENSHVFFAGIFKEAAK